MSNIYFSFTLAHRFPCPDGRKTGLIMGLQQLLLWTAACVLVFLRVPADGKRVMVMPTPLTSHVNFLAHVARSLARLDHQVWLTMPDYIVRKGVLNTTNITVIEYSTFTNVEDDMMTGMVGNYFKGKPDDWALFSNLAIQFCDDLLSNTSFLEQIRSVNPEFILLDSLPFMKMMTVIPYRLGVPFAFAGVTYDPNTQRIPVVGCNIPVPLFKFNEHMHFYQRVVNSLVYMYDSLTHKCAYKDAVSRYAPEMPYLPLDMLIARAEIWLVETDHILDYPKASLPNVRLIGGTATGPARSLSLEFKSFMDGAEEGVVVVSFGSYVLNPPEHVVVKLMDVLRKLPMKSVVRLNVSSPDPKKILTSSWIPQNDLLGHPNTRVFVSHCGNGGQYEALYHAVPVVAAPIFSDQFYNAERMRVKGFAEVVDLNSVSPGDLRATILKVTTNSTYKQAITKASELFKIEFGVPMERAAFWLDHVMKYGGSHMRSAGQEISFYQFSCWDVYAFFVAGLLFVLLIIIFLVRRLRQCLSICPKQINYRVHKKMKNS